MKKGKLIVLEGADCSGKSTVIEKLKIVLPVISDDNFVFSREPGSTLPESHDECEEIRKEILSSYDITPEKQTELFAKSRLIHTKEIIKELNKGNNVILDRYLLSSMIYQGEELGKQYVIYKNKEIIKLLQENNITIHNIVFQMSEETYLKRLEKRNEHLDALEQVDYDKVLKRIYAFNSLSYGQIDDINFIYEVDADGENYARICIDTLSRINEIIK